MNPNKEMYIWKVEYKDKDGKSHFIEIESEYPTWTLEEKVKADYPDCKEVIWCKILSKKF